jgi:hypothetical protein
MLFFAGIRRSAIMLRSGNGKWVGDMSIEILYNEQDGQDRSDNAD